MDIFKDLDDGDNAEIKAGPARQQFPCQQCAGTGFYQGRRVHQEKEHCFACRGKGYFLSSAADRRKAAGQRPTLRAAHGRLLLLRAQADQPRQHRPWHRPHLPR